MSTLVEGPVPTRRFIKEWLHVDIDVRLTDPSRAEHFKTLRQAVGTELAGPDDMLQGERVDRFIKALRVRGMLPKTMFIDRTGSGSHSKRKTPDCSLYDRAKLPQGDEMHKHGVADSVHASIFVEVKRIETQDCFFDTESGTIIRPYDSHRKVFGQVHDYANQLMRNNYRTHCYIVFSFGTKARLLRFDHSAVYATEAFSLADESPLLSLFFHAFAGSQNDMHCGWDDTVYPDKALELAAHVRAALDAKKANDQNIRRYRKSFEGPLQCFIVQKDATIRYTCVAPFHPVVQSHTLIGRATRGWPVWVVEVGALAWYKRAWRVDHAGIDPEGLTYEKLAAAEVRCVPTIMACGDVGRDRRPEDRNPFNTTTSAADAVRHQPWFKGHMCNHTHYEILMREVGTPLWLFKSPVQATRAIRDALEAYTDALEKAHVLHRDVSVGNIMILSTGNGQSGMLCDWDLSCYLRESNDERRARQSVRTGTWQFLSYALSNDPYATHSVHDDTESFVYVLLWLAMRYMANNFQKDEESYGPIFVGIFNSWAQVENRPRRLSNHSKKSWLLHGDIGPDSFRITDHVQLTKLLDDARTLFSTRYSSTTGTIYVPVKPQQLLALFDVALSTIKDKSLWPKLGTAMYRAHDYLPHNIVKSESQSLQPADAAARWVSDHMLSSSKAMSSSMLTPRPNKRRRDEDDLEFTLSKKPRTQDPLLESQASVPAAIDTDESGTNDDNHYDQDVALDEADKAQLAMHGWDETNDGVGDEREEPETAI